MEQSKMIFLIIITLIFYKLLKLFQINNSSTHISCDVKHEPCDVKPTPLILDNFQQLKDFLEEGNYSYNLHDKRTHSKKYPNGYMEKGSINITHKSKRIDILFKGNRYLNDGNQIIPINNHFYYTHNFKNNVISHFTNSLGANGNGYLIKFDANEIIFLWESNSESIGKDIWYKSSWNKTDKGYKGSLMQTTNLNKEWTFAYSSEYIKID